MAQETYTQYYSGVPCLTEAPMVCDQGLEKNDLDEATSVGSLVSAAKPAGQTGHCASGHMGYRSYRAHR